MLGFDGELLEFDEEKRDFREEMRGFREEMLESAHAKFASGGAPDLSRRATVDRDNAEHGPRRATDVREQ
jgi:hypothetical protein